MKKFLLVLALVAVSGLHADVQQNLQTAKEKVLAVKQGAKAVGARVADSFNIPKHFRLLKVAKADLQACGIAQCSLLHKKVARLNEKIQQLESQIAFKNRETTIEKRDALSSKRATIEREYQACMASKCPTQYQQYRKKRADYAIRVARVAAVGAYGTAATIGVASVVAQDRMDKARRAADRHAYGAAVIQSIYEERKQDELREYQAKMAKEHAPSAPPLDQTKSAIYKSIKVVPYRRPGSMRVEEIPAPAGTNYPGLYAPTQGQSPLPVDKRSMYADYSGN